MGPHPLSVSLLNIVRAVPRRAHRPPYLNLHKTPKLPIIRAFFIKRTTDTDESAKQRD